jgi:hypothetical protein
LCHLYRKRELRKRAAAGEDANVELAQGRRLGGFVDQPVSTLRRLDTENGAVVAHLAGIAVAKVICVKRIVEPESNRAVRLFGRHVRPDHGCGGDVLMEQAESAVIVGIHKCYQLAGLELAVNRDRAESRD